MSMPRVTYICELENSELSKVRQTVVRGVLVHNEGDILHRLRTEPLRHFQIRFVYQYDGASPLSVVHRGKAPGYPEI